MINPELSKFIQDQRAAGSSDEQIKVALLAKGWAQADVDGAFAPQGSSMTGTGGQLLPIGATIKQAWAIFTENVAQYLSIMVILTLLTIGWSIYTSSQQANYEPGDPAAIVAMYPSLIVFVVLATVVGVFTQLMISFLILRRQEKLTTAQVFQMSLSKFWGSLWISFLTGIIVMVGFFLLIVPGVYLAIATMFASYIYLDQGVTGYDAITKSRNYVKGLWGSVFSRMFVAGLIYVVASVIVTIPFSNNPNASSIATSILSLVLTPLGVIYMVLVYEQLKAIKGTSV